MFLLPEFPENRKADPKRQGELRVYNKLAQSGVTGLAIYGGKASPEGPEVDFALWLQKEGRFSMEVKASRYTFEDGRWVLHSVNGPEVVDSPVLQARDSAMHFRDAVKESLGRKVFVYAVVIFPDLDPDQDIIKQAARHKVHPIFGTGELGDRLLAIAGSQEIFMPPTASHIQEEAELFIPGVRYPAGTEVRRTERGATPSADMDIIARQVVIQNAGVVNIYTTGEQV